MNVKILVTSAFCSTGHKGNIRFSHFIALLGKNDKKHQMLVQLEFPSKTIPKNPI
jgi:hypothetical protein